MRKIFLYDLKLIKALYNHFEPKVYWRGSLVIALVRLSVGSSIGPSVRWSVFKYLRVFSHILHEVRAPEGCKSDKARILKKFGGGHIFGAFVWMFLAYISLHPVIKIYWNSIYVISSTLSKTFRKLHAEEKSGFGCIIGTRPLFLRLRQFFVFLGIFVVFHIMSVVMQ